MNEGCTAPGDDAILFGIENPKPGEKLASRDLCLRGWCLDMQLRDFKGIRARIGDEIFKAKRKQSRTGVALMFPNHPDAPLSGFSSDIILPKGGSNLIEIEYRLIGGNWEKLQSIEVKSPSKIALFFAKKNLANNSPDYRYDSDYEHWIEKYDTISNNRADEIKNEITTWDNLPKFSVVIPVYNTPEKFLIQCIESVEAQLYSNWELCIANDASPDPQVKILLDQYAEKNKNIHVSHRTESGHICAATNTALELASGDFVVLLDHDDTLPNNALYEVAKALQKQPELDIIYSDEDKIDADNRRMDPYFKPDFNYDLLLAQNCISHLGVYRRELIEKVGGFREGMQGSQDWDLVLRCLEKTQAKKVCHIPKILYHWRILAGSTSISTDEKPYAVNAGKKAVSDHLARTGNNAVRVTTDQVNYMRLHWPLPDPQPQVTIIIPSRNHAALLSAAIDSVLNKTTYKNYNILIVNNDSDESESIDYLRKISEHERVSVINVLGDFNYPKLNNIGCKTATGTVLCLLNNDITVIEPDWLSEMVSHALRPDIAAVGAKLLYPETDTIQHAGVILGGGDAPARHAYYGLPSTFPTGGHRANLANNYSAVTAACLVIEKKKYIEVGGMDEVNFPVAFNDIDFCLRLQKLGYRNLYTPYATLYHHESASRKMLDQISDEKTRAGSEIKHFIEKWRTVIEHDPGTNPNLFLAAQK